MSSLKPLDLEGLVAQTFGVDIFDAKAGDNADVCVISFRVDSEEPANDLSQFLEKEGPWILDSDISTGEDATGKYLVFVEIKRNHRLPDRIMDLLDVIEKLTGTVEWQFTVGKRQIVHNAAKEELAQFIAKDPSQYGESLEEERYEKLSEFFDGTTYNTMSVKENRIKLQQFFQDWKPHSELGMTILSEDPADEELNEHKVQINMGQTSAVNWLNKVMGQDITVESAGSNFLLTNSKTNKRLLVKLHV